MTQKKKKPKLTKEEREMYVSGYMCGVHEADRQIKLFQLTNKRLRAELKNLDVTQPLNLLFNCQFHTISISYISVSYNPYLRK